MTDAFKHLPVMDKEGNEVPGLFQVASAKVNKEGISVNVGCGNEFGGGEEDVDDAGAELVNNVIDESLGFNLQEVPMGKADLKEYLKEYCKKVRQALKDDDNVPGPKVKEFTQSAPKLCNWFLSMYKELIFYITPSMDPEAAMAFCYYDVSTPMFVYIKAGLIEEKV